MTATRKRARCAFAVLVVCWSLVAPAVAAGQDEDSTPRTADEFLEDSRELEGHEAFQEYSEFEVVRAQAVSAVQVGTFTDEEARRMKLVYEALVTFEEAYNLSSSGSRIESIERANETSSLLVDLRTVGGNQYAALMKIALDRFYKSQGKALHEAALAANDTPTKLELMGNAATAYQLGGAVERYSNLVVQRERLQSTYRADVKTVNESATAAKQFLSQCDGACGSPDGAVTTHGLAVFDMYATARTTTDRLDAAADAAAEHGLTERARSLRSMRARTQSAVFTLAIASAVIGLGIGLALAVVATIVTHRLVSWARDVEDSQVGEIVLAEEVVHG